MANPIRALNTFVQHDAPVTCVRYNPVDKALSSGANDRTVKYWDLDSYSLVYKYNCYIYNYCIYR